MQLVEVYMGYQKNIKYHLLGKGLCTMCQFTKRINPYVPMSIFNTVSHAHI